MDFDVGSCRGANAEVQTGVAGGKITGLTEHLLRLHLAAVADQDTCPDGVAIALHSFQTDLDPAVAVRRVVAQQRRRLIDVYDQGIHIAVVIEIAKGQTAAAMAGNDAGTGPCAELGESAVTSIAK